MQTQLSQRLAGNAVLWLLCVACSNQQSNPSKDAPSSGAKEQPVAAAKSPLAASNVPVADAAPLGCKASGTTPTKLGTTVGEIHGFTGDATSLYFASWQLYGSRGNLGKLRKDGGGSENLVSLSFEPRAIVVDDQDIFYSEGIRLMKIPKAGGTPTTIAPKFSSLSIAIHGADVYGVPGDYGPYDRLVKVNKNGGVNYDLDVSERPEAKTGPVGYSGIAVDTNGVYVTDSGGNRVLRFALERAKPKVIAPAQPKAFSLAADAANIYFTLADKGLLMVVPKAGGGAKKMAVGLVQKSRIAADDSAVVAVFAGGSADADQEIALVPTDGGSRRKLASVTNSHSVEGVALDKDCVYWAERATGSGAVDFLAIARQ